MKKLSTYLFLILFSFQTSSWADDIRDFQIEGMSVGDSLLEYFSEEKIRKQISPTLFTSKKYIKILFDVRYDDVDFLKIYQVIGFYVKANDKKYTIASINAMNSYRKKIEACLKDKDKIFEEISGLFENAEIFKNVKRDHPSDPTGESKIYGHYFEFKSGAAGKVTCVDFSKKFEEKKYEDHLRVTIGQNDYTDWLMNEAYK